MWVVRRSKARKLREKKKAAGEPAALAQCFE
jgi:hypothetical protein